MQQERDKQEKKEKKKSKIDPKPLHKQVAASGEDISPSPSLEGTGKGEAVRASSVKAKDNYLSLC